MSGHDSKYFSTTKKGEIPELKEELNSQYKVHLRCFDLLLLQHCNYGLIDSRLFNYVDFTCAILVPFLYVDLWYLPVDGCVSMDLGSKQLDPVTSPFDCDLYCSGFSFLYLICGVTMCDLFLSIIPCTILIRVAIKL